jgi:hypothetical protein
MPYRPHALDCPRRNTATIGNLATQKRRWPGPRPRLCSDRNRRHFALDDGGSMPRFGHVQASYFPPRRCREEHCEALRLGHLQLLLLKMALLSPAAPVRRRHPHAPTTRAHRGRRIQAESRASEKRILAPSPTRRADSGQPRIRRALFPKCHRGIPRHASRPCRTVRISRSPTPARRGRPAAVRRGPACERP